jgi:paraquat-inducible protein B
VIVTHDWQHLRHCRPRDHARRPDSINHRGKIRPASRSPDPWVRQFFNREPESGQSNTTINLNEQANNFKLGLFTLGGLALLVAGILAFGARSYFVRTSVFETYVAGDVAGLAVGSPVELRGVRVGKVRNINFSWNEYGETQPSYVVVEFEMRNDVTPMPPGAARRGECSSQRSAEVSGAPQRPGHHWNQPPPALEYLNQPKTLRRVPWRQKHIYIPAAPGLLSELLASIERSLRNVERLDFGALNQLLQNDLKSVGQVLDRAKEVDFGALSTNANSLLTELRGSNTKLQSFIVNADETVRRMKLEKVAQDLDGLLGNLSETVEGLKPGLSNIDFDALNQTLGNAHRTLGDLDDVLLELKQYPSGFLFGNPPSHVKEVQPSARK